MRTRSSKDPAEHGDVPSLAGSLSWNQVQVPRAAIWLGLGTLLFSVLWFFTPPSVLESYDYIFFYEPNFQFLLDALKDGRLPLWNPFIGLGRPYLADVQNAVFYPPLYLIFVGKEAGVFLLIWLHSTLAVFGMVKLGEALQMKRAPALLVAFSFLACGAVSGRIFAGQLLYWAALCYLPLLFWFAARLDDRWRWRSLGLYALVLALQFLCGHPQAFWISVLGQSVFIVARHALPWSDRGRYALRAVAQFLSAVVWCAVIVAVALLPFLELVREGNRQLSSAEFVNFGKFAWPQLVSLAHPMRGALNLDWERILFIGAPLLLAGLLGCGRFRDRNVRALFVTALVAILIGIGDATPLFSFFQHALPGYSSFRLHARLGVLVAFVLLCAGGCWLSSPQALKILPFWLRCHSRLAFGILIGLQVAHLAYGAVVMKLGYSTAVITQAPLDFSVQNKLAASLRERGLLARGAPPPRISVPRVLMPPNDAMAYGFGHFDAYTSLFLRRPWLFIHFMADFPPPEFKNTFVDRRIYEHGSFPVPTISLQAAVTLPQGEIVFASNAEPRAYIAFNAQPVKSFDQALRRMREGHDIYQFPLLEPNSGLTTVTEPRKPVVALIEDFQPNELRIKIDVGQAGWLVLSEAYYPGWRLEAKGRSVAAVPINAWMRAFPIEAGAYSARVVYRQNHLPMGAILSAAGLFAVLLSMLGGRWRGTTGDVIMQRRSNRPLG